MQLQLLKYDSLSQEVDCMNALKYCVIIKILVGELGYVVAHALFSEETKQIEVTPGMPGVVLLCSN